MAKWIIAILKWIPKEEVAKLLVEILKDLAKDSENELDDKAIQILEAILKKAFGND